MQLGLDGVIWEYGPLRLEGIGKASLYLNHVESDFIEQSNTFGNFGNSVDDTLAFLGELGLNGVVQLTPSLALRAGYQLMWLEGVGIASEQINNTGNFQNAPGVRIPTTVDDDGSLFYHGATVGFEFVR